MIKPLKAARLPKRDRSNARPRRKHTSSSGLRDNRANRAHHRLV